MVEDERDLDLDAVFVVVCAGVTDGDLIFYDLVGEFLVDGDVTEGGLPGAFAVDGGDGGEVAVGGAEDYEGVDGFVDGFYRGEDEFGDLAAEGPAGVGDDAGGDGVGECWQVGGFFEEAEFFFACGFDGGVETACDYGSSCLHGSPCLFSLTFSSVGITLFLLYILNVQAGKENGI